MNFDYLKYKYKYSTHSKFVVICVLFIYHNNYDRIQFLVILHSITFILSLNFDISYFLFSLFLYAMDLFHFNTVFSLFTSF